MVGFVGFGQEPVDRGLEIDDAFEDPVLEPLPDIPTDEAALKLLFLGSAMPACIGAGRLNGLTQSGNLPSCSAIALSLQPAEG